MHCEWTLWWFKVNHGVVGGRGGGFPRINRSLFRHCASMASVEDVPSVLSWVVFVEEG